MHHKTYINNLLYKFLLFIFINIMLNINIDNDNPSSINAFKSSLHTGYTHRNKNKKNKISNTIDTNIGNKETLTLLMKETMDITTSNSNKNEIVSISCDNEKSLLSLVNNTNNCIDIQSSTLSPTVSNADSSIVITGNNANIYWRSIPMSHLRYHPMFISLPLPEHVTQYSNNSSSSTSLQWLKLYRQDSWQWNALHTGR